jgi:hypothetical protein
MFIVGTGILYSWHNYVIWFSGVIFAVFIIPSILGICFSVLDITCYKKMRSILGIVLSVFSTVICYFFAWNFYGIGGGAGVW